MIKIHNNIRKYKEIIRVAFAFRVKSLVIHLVNLAKELNKANLHHGVIKKN